MWARYLQLPRAVYLLCAGTLINRAGTLLIPFLTLYLTEHMHTTVRFAAWAMAAYGIGAIGAVLVGGHLADTLGRRAIMLASLTGSAALMVILSAVATPWGVVACLVVLGFVGEMYRPACSAMIADLVPGADRQFAYGLQYISVNLGFAVAPPVGGLIVHYWSYTLLFWADAATTLALALIILLCLSETLHLARAEQTDDAGDLHPHFADLRAALREFRLMFGHGTFMVFCGATLCLAMVYMQAMSTLPLYMKTLGFNEAQYGRILMINGAMIAALQIPMTAVIARFPREWVVPVAALVTGLGFVLTAPAVALWHLGATVVVWTVGEMMAAPLAPGIVADLAPPRLRARYMGMLSLCFASGNVFGVPLGGEVLDRWGGPTLWVSTLLLTVLAAVLYFSIRRPVAEAAGIRESQDQNLARLQRRPIPEAPEACP